MPGTRKTRDPYATERTVPFTNREMEAIFGVTGMTLHNWGHGSPTRAPLPRTKRGREVRYAVRSTMSWARRHEVPVVVHPDDLPLPGAPAPVPVARKKPGPKPKASAVSYLASERPSAR